MTRFVLMIPAVLLAAACGGTSTPAGPHLGTVTNGRTVQVEPQVAPDQQGAGQPTTPNLTHPAPAPPVHPPAQSPAATPGQDQPPPAGDRCSGATGPPGKPQPFCPPL